jgi:cellulose synthase/poly-beta-1,6-N-acetylglucosamine synthase-like glycosyltransferase
VTHKIHENWSPTNNDSTVFSDSRILSLNFGGLKIANKHVYNYCFILVRRLPSFVNSLSLNSIFLFVYFFLLQIYMEYHFTINIFLWNLVLQMFLKHVSTSQLCQEKDVKWLGKINKYHLEGYRHWSFLKYIYIFQHVMFKIQKWDIFNDEQKRGY